MEEASKARSEQSLVSSSPRPLTRESTGNELPEGRSPLQTTETVAMPAPRTPPPILGTIVYVETFRLFFCVLCRQVLAGSQVSRHMSKGVHRQRGHHTFKWKQQLQQQLQQQCPEQNGVVTNLAHIAWPKVPVYAISQLPVYADGKKCTRCLFITRSCKVMIEQRRAKHQWTGPRSTVGKQRRVPYDRWRDQVRCQQLFTSGPFARLFEVVEEGSVGHGEAIQESSTLGRC